jgi:putative methionine-R-sulfoxide reductase with GAF domain
LKIYLDSAVVLARIDCLLADTPPSFRHSPLDKVMDVLCRDRHYSWVGVYLTAGKTNAQLLGAGGEPHPGQMARPETKSKILISLKLAGRELGVLDVESDRENAFASKDRVLLENVAQRLGRFLAGPGRYIVRKTRAAAIGKA